MEAEDSARLVGRVILVMSDGTSTVGRLADTLIKISTSQAELELKVCDIFYVYRGRARISKDEEVLSGDVLTKHLEILQGDGIPTQVSVEEIIFLAPVPRDAPTGPIAKIAVIGADGKVNRTFSAPARGESSENIVVSILDEYSTERLFTLANPAYPTVISKDAKSSPVEVQFDVSRHTSHDKKVLVALGYRAKAQGSELSQETTCYSPRLSSLDLAREEKQPSKHGFTCFTAVEGDGDMYLYIADGEAREGHTQGLELAPSSRLPLVRFYRTVSNVLKLPVRFE